MANKRLKRTIKYHGRAGKPMVHTTATGRKYIMVRAKGGGVKRLYEGSLYTEGRGGKKIKLRLRNPIKPFAKYEDIPFVLKELVRVRAGYEGGKFLRGEILRLSKKERDTIDKWLISIKHPLIYEPSTQEYRIEAIIKELARYGKAVRKSN